MHWQFGEMEFGEMKRNTSNWRLEQFLHHFESRGFVSVSWAFLFLLEWSRGIGAKPSF